MIRLHLHAKHLTKANVQNSKLKTQNSKLKKRGQALVVVALMMSVLILFVGLGIDAGNMMGKAAKLQSAVDAAALSAAQELSSGGTLTQTVETKAFQILEANGIPSATLAMQPLVEFPPEGPNQVRIRVVQSVPTYFMRIIPMWRMVQVHAEATADFNSYAEITTKPYGQAGVVNELNMMVWGKDSYRRGGDVYSPISGTGSPPALTRNPEHSKQPYGYLFRIDVPPSYSSDHLAVQFFDPDTYNRPGSPPAPPTPYPCPGPQCGQPTPTPSADQYAYCPSSTSTCTSGAPTTDSSSNTGMKISAFPNGRPAFWRVDEIRTPYTDTGGIRNIYNAGYGTTTRFSLWHFNPRITSAFGNPATLSDRGANPLAQYSIGWDASTDLSWIRPADFDLTLRIAGVDQFERETNGSFYFYLYIEGIAGSSENNYDIRVGPPEANTTQACTDPATCRINQLYLNNSQNSASWPDWQDGGARVFAKRALPLNLVTGDSFPLAFTQVSKNAAGQTLEVRHFDQDCGTGSAAPCGTPMQYQMQICGCSPLTNPACWADIGVGYVGPNDVWADEVYGKEFVTIPAEGTALYNQLFGASCPTSWLRIESNPSYSGDTTVWEMPYIRPRLVK